MLSSSMPEPAVCLSGFESINRYWDRHRKCHVAKILPGEFYVGNNIGELISTTLGSCVSACIWDESAGIGGMNHFMLPLTSEHHESVTWGNLPSDATRYGNYAMEHMINELLTHGALRNRLQARVFGGAKVLKALSDVGQKNALFVLDYLVTESIPVLTENLLDVFPRKVLFDPLTGKTLMKKLRSTHNNTIVNREEDYKTSISDSSVEGAVELF